MTGTSGNPRYYAQKRPHVGGTPISDSEPYLVIRAQDVLALDMIDHYLHLYGHVPPDKRDPQVVGELEDHRRRIVDWQRDHRTKFADR